MAEYWTKINSDEFSNVLNNYTSLPRKFTEYYAKGPDLDLFNFISFDFGWQLKCYICNTDFETLKIENYFLSNTSRDSNIIIFENCSIVSIEITTSNISKVIFNNCNIDSLKFINNTSNFNFILENTEVTYLNISSNKNNLSIEIKKSIIDTCVINSNSEINRLYIDFSTLNKFKCESNNISKIHLYDINSNGKYLFRLGKITQSLSVSGCRDIHIEFESLQIDCKRIDFLVTNNNDITFHSVRFLGESVLFHFFGRQSSNYNIYKCYFQSEVQFSGFFETSTGNLKLIDSVFCDLVIFESVKVKPKGIILTRSLFQKGILLPALEIGNFSLLRQILKNIRALEKPFTIKKLIHSFIALNSEIKEIHSSVWCTLKNQAIGRNDHITALEYRKNEFISYRSELFKQNGKCQEKIVLGLNFISNNHGLSWMRGLFFTLFSGVLFYSLFTISLNNFDQLHGCLICNKFFWQDALNYFWLAHGVNELNEGFKHQLSFLSTISMVLSFFFGKIIIGYGIFQTIAAFRRHGK